MNYQFPKLMHLDDVLPAIEGYDEFIVAEKEGYNVVNYVVSKDTTFQMNGPDDLHGAIRRECRGLIFGENGKLLSRPFHKFFNVNEKEETQTNNLDFSHPHIIMNKMDGSMIRPFYIDGMIRLGTKMGVTDTAMQAEVWAAQNPWFYTWVDSILNLNWTPIFEWISPKNRIVIDYGFEDLVLLAIRDNYTGEYLSLDPTNGWMAKWFGFYVNSYDGNIGDQLNDYLSKVRDDTDREGDVVRFSDGHMVKIKSEWYVTIHKIKDLVQSDRHIARAILDEEVDDTVAMLPEHDRARVREFEERFWHLFNEKEEIIGEVCKAAYAYSDGDRKKVAVEFIPTLNDKNLAKFIFGYLDGKSVYMMLVDAAYKSVGSNTKFDQYMEWMEK